MKKLISFLGSLLLIGSSSAVAVSCWWDIPGIGIIASDCYDENWNNVTDVGSDNEQWWDLWDMTLYFSWLSKKIFPDSNAFYQKLNNKNSNLIGKYFRGPENEVIQANFYNDFTFLITNYDSITSTVIAQMQENELKNKEAGTYLFLNLPDIDLNNIQYEWFIDFQFIFMIKDETGNISGNKYNNWFYWDDWQILNWNATSIAPNEQYLFTLSEFLETQRVVTNYF